MDAVLAEFEVIEEDEEVPSYDDDEHALRIAVVGRPNVGKSTLINRMIGEDRLVVYDQPGTTRDSVSVPFEKNDRKYELIDTAGIRRKSKVHEVIEKFSIIKALQAIDRAEVVISVLDAHEGVTEQDVSLLGLILERGRSLVVVTNKWDGMSSEDRKHVRDELDRRLPFLDFAERMTISALHGTAVGDVLPAVERAFRAAVIDMSTPDLTRELESAVTAHPPPLVSGRRIRSTLRAPGWSQSARDCYPRQPDRKNPGSVPTLPDQSLPQGIQAQGHPGQAGIQVRQEPL